jgi:hypothetical protein
MTQRFAADGYRLRKLLKEITTSPAFYAVSADADTTVAKVGLDLRLEDERWLSK